MDGPAESGARRAGSRAALGDSPSRDRGPSRQEPTPWPNNRTAASDLQQKYRQFLDLMPLTMSLAGLPTSEGRLFSEEQIEARAITVRAAYRVARSDRQGMPERVVRTLPVGPARSLRIARRALFDRGREADKNRVARGPPRGTGTPAARHALHSALHSRKALLEMTMTTQPDGGPRRLRAAIIGFGLDGQDSQQRLSTGDQCLLVGGSAETHAEMLETMLRLESELDRRGQRLAEVNPTELAEIAWRIDSPELHEIALRLADSLERRGRRFEDLTAEELTELSAPIGVLTPHSPAFPSLQTPTAAATPKGRGRRRRLSIPQVPGADWLDAGSSGVATEERLQRNEPRGCEFRNNGVRGEVTPDDDPKRGGGRKAWGRWTTVRWSRRSGPAIRMPRAC